MPGRLIYLGLFFFLIADIGYSFLQFYGTPLDGDMAGGIVPSKDVEAIFDSPLGGDVILKNKSYPNPNRFFSHFLFKEYFSLAPHFIQKFANPIDSIYLSCAISKTLVQLALIILLAMAISGTGNILKMEFIVAAVLVTPLFQANGYRGYMGIIDSSATYTFFYALPCGLLLLYFTPFISQYYHFNKPSQTLFGKIIWMAFAIVICLSGPLNPGISIICSILIISVNTGKNYSHSVKTGIIKKILASVKLIPKNYWYFLLPLCLLSIYSLYIGRYNSIDIANRNSLKVLYLKLPAGIYYTFFQKLGFPVLFSIIILNALFIGNKFKNKEAYKILNMIKWIGVFALIYILLLPLGGYRTYRPYILRYDTIMPITLSLMFLFGVTTLFLFKTISSRQKIWYIPLIALVLIIFTNADKPGFDSNNCEKHALREISESPGKIVPLKNDCTVLSWVKINKPEDSELNAQLLMKWGITKSLKLYYNK
jgi:hypothetical protein